MKSLKVKDLTIAYLDEGAGRPVVLAHCSSASHKQWRPLISLLKERARVLAPDLIGYGKSDSWPEEHRLDVEADARVLKAIIGLCEEPVHLAGHSYGAAMALEAARLCGERVKTLTLVEPVSFHLLRPAGRTREYDMIDKVVRRVSNAMEKGRPRRAAAAYMGFWLGRLKWWACPRDFKAGVIRTVGKVAKEFQSIEAAPDLLDAFAKLDVPTRLIVGAKTKQPAKAVVEILQQTLPNAHVKVIAGAGHMSPFTHTGEVNRLIVEHIDSVKAEV